MIAESSINILSARLAGPIRDCARTPGHPFATALPRWSESARRLGLSDIEWVVGATLLALELEPTLRLDPEAAGPRTRSELLAMAGDGLGNGGLPALATLEARTIIESPKNARGGWSGVPISLNERVRAYCLGVTGDSRFAQAQAHGLVQRVASQLDHLATLCKETGGRDLHVVLRGATGAGHDAAAAVFLAAFDARDCTRTPLELRAAPEDLEPALSGGVAVLDARGAEMHPDDLHSAAAFLRRSTGICLSLLGARDDAPTLDDRALVAIDLEPADHDERRTLWREALASRAPASLVSPLAESLASQTRAGAALVDRVARTADPPPESTVEAWIGALRTRLDDAVQPSQTQGVIVERPRARLGDLVLPDVARGGLEMLAIMAAHAPKLAAPHRAGVKALLAGPPGTGKTLAARALAGDLARPLYRVDLAAITSKWVGETEKNLRRALDAGETAGAVLLFDEGDALFGRRGDVERGSDRYANLEVSFLLQAIEELDAILLVTTNLRANFDPAFTRRFDLCLDFARPDAALRLALWRRELGPEVGAISPTLLADIAAGVELSGGHVAVACRLARAFALARARRMVDADLVLGLVTELRNMGSNMAAARWEASLSENGESHGRR